MRRSTRLGLAVAIVVLFLLGGVYTAFWFVVAGRIEDGIGQAGPALRAQNVDLSWQSVHVGGYPLAFRIELGAARLRNAADAKAGEVRLPQLSASAWPWNFRTWKLSAADGLTALAGAVDLPVAKLTAQALTGSVTIAGDNAVAIRLNLDKPLVESDVRVAAKDAEVRLNLPAHPPQSHTEPAFHIALDAHDLTLPTVPAPLHNPLDQLSFGATLMGPLPAGPPSRAAAAWRDAGGTLELDQFRLRWGDLAINGSGTVALDSDLQPIGGFSGGIEGYDALMNALVTAGRMRASDARLARLGLAMLAKAGPDGRPEISTSFTIQNGEMYLGPAKLGKAPRIAW
jgi:hypothetical protein